METGKGATVTWVYGSMLDRYRLLHNQYLFYEAGLFFSSEAPGLVTSEKSILFIGLTKIVRFFKCLTL